jgi:CTP synthase
MRLGGQTVKIKSGTLAHKLYGKNSAIERFRHRYEINPKYVKIAEKRLKPLLCQMKLIV